MTHDLRQAFDVHVAYATATRTDLRDDDLATAEDISRMTGMSLRWVYETFSVPARGGLRPMKIGNKSRWYTWEVKAWIHARHREAGNR